MNLALCRDGEKAGDAVSLGNWYDLDTSSHTGYFFSTAMFEALLDSGDY